MIYCNQAGITDAAFAHLTGIRTLDMSYCNQAGITDMAFAHLAGIHTLDMRRGALGPKKDHGDMQVSYLPRFGESRRSDGFAPALGVIPLTTRVRVRVGVRVSKRLI